MFHIVISYLGHHQLFKCFIMSRFKIIVIDVHVNSFFKAEIFLIIINSTLNRVEALKRFVTCTRMSRLNRRCLLIF